MSCHNMQTLLCKTWMRPANLSAIKMWPLNMYRLKTPDLNIPRNCKMLQGISCYGPPSRLLSPLTDTTTSYLVLVLVPRSHLQGIRHHARWLLLVGAQEEHCPLPKIADKRRTRAASHGVCWLKVRGLLLLLLCGVPGHIFYSRLRLNWWIYFVVLSGT
jgi:hypothetical protein